MDYKEALTLTERGNLTAGAKKNLAKDLSKAYRPATGWRWTCRPATA